MNKKNIRAALLGAPSAVIAVGTFASIWETPRIWIGDQFARLAAMMTNPFVTMAVTLFVVLYLAATFWSYVEPRPVPITASELHEAERLKDNTLRRRKLIDDARKMVSRFEIHKDRSWRDLLRVSPDTPQYDLI